MSAGMSDIGYMRDFNPLTGTGAGGGNVSVPGFIRGNQLLCQAGDGSAQAVTYQSTAISSTARKCLNWIRKQNDTNADICDEQFGRRLKTFVRQ